MTDWAHPVLSDTYSSVLTTYLNGRDVDAITLQSTPASNPPTNAIKLLRAPVKFQNYNGATYDDLLLDITGGGTGAATAAGARTALGLGTMATQNSTGVAITGGSISGVTLDASTITTGVVALARGGTGASLAIGAAGEFLQSVAGAVAFGHDGSNLNNLNASNISTGTLNILRLPAGFGGRLIQVVQRTSTVNISTGASGVFVSLDAFVIITPTSVTSRISVRMNINYDILLGANRSSFLSFRIKRNGTIIATYSPVASVNGGPTAGVNTEASGIMPLEFLDAPASVAALTYLAEVAVTSTLGLVASGSVNHGFNVYTATEIAPN